MEAAVHQLVVAMEATFTMVSFPKRYGACISSSKSTAVFPRSFLRSRRAPASTKTRAASNLPVRMANIKAVAPWLW
eukprot:Skav221049  [mRNA]  locus=scaffold1448:309484:309800:- [translate_table: standard]